MKLVFYFILLFSPFLLIQCKQDDEAAAVQSAVWVREATPVCRDFIEGANYQVASDPHVFVDNGQLWMIYMGDKDGSSAIKLAKGSAKTQWQPLSTLLGNTGPSGWDIQKETAFYRKAANGKHQIYYIGYPIEETYEAQLFLAEADALSGPYTQMDHPIVPKGNIAGHPVYCITSPSVVEHGGILFLTFLGWNYAPDQVTVVWAMGATSTDHGHSWSNFQLIDAPIGMEGQITKLGANHFVAVRTGTFENKEAIYYATASHPFGPYTQVTDPLLVQAGPPYEKDEIIAPSIFIDPATGEEILYYTGADYTLGWWIMMAHRQ